MLVVATSAGTKLELQDARNSSVQAVNAKGGTSAAEAPSSKVNLKTEEDAEDSLMLATTSTLDL